MTRTRGWKREVRNRLPAIPECENGYTQSQLRPAFAEHLLEFVAWARDHNAFTVCTGFIVNPSTGQREECCNGVAHGVVFYSYDVARYLHAPLTTPTAPDI